jgi:hypothetical protein
MLKQFKSIWYNSKLWFFVSIIGAWFNLWIALLAAFTSVLPAALVPIFVLSGVCLAVASLMHAWTMKRGL